jgi:hypothetical protein
MLLLHALKLTGSTQVPINSLKIRQEKTYMQALNKNTIDALYKHTAQ